MNFYLIQRGSFKELNNDYEGLTGRNGLIDLDYMGSSEFEWGAIPKAYRRIMGNRENYIFYYCHDIKDYRGKILVIFCKKENAEAIEEELKRYIKEHYHLKEFCTLHAHLEGSKKNRMNEYQIGKDFFWCIDIGEDISDWMAWFGMDKLTVFKNMIDKDYNEWWMKKAESERIDEYNKALNW
ncbi:hypothetical protein [Konateibacter massiliensis]|uniref:hypothetical protein n=1 Tax=Konateibacter massiliensis TaxID=2002841 RepID=UPI000C15EA00|nr:hypothetical protein [Konateibacter massiliensis]